jgi:hypothetical protein
MVYDPILEEGIKEMRAGATLQEAARFAKVRDERLRQYLTDTGVGIFDRGRWRIGQDRRPRRVVFYSRGRAVEITVAGYEEAAAVGRYMHAVARLAATNRPTRLARFRGSGVVDIRARFHPYETDPNTLYRLLAAGPEPFEQIYRIVI